MTLTGQFHWENTAAAAHWCSHCIHALQAKVDVDFGRRRKPPMIGKTKSAMARENTRFYNFKSVELVHIGRGPADIVAIAGGGVEYIDDNGRGLVVDLTECARIYRCLRDAYVFPPAEDLDWPALIDEVPGFATLELPLQAVVGLRGAVDQPPWFQFLNRRRTQFEFKDYDHIQSALLKPLAIAGRWYSWDAS
jgi:hypothetical protein